MTKFKDKSFSEQIEEARQHTTAEKARDKPGLSQTAYDHIIRCGTAPDERMLDNPGTPLIDFLNEEEVIERIEAHYNICNPNYTREALETDIRSAIQRENSIKSGLTEMILYLSKVGRLPQKYSHIVITGDKK